MKIEDFFNQLMIGNGSVINSDNIAELNKIALEIYNKPQLNRKEVETLQQIVMSCNILYNRTDMTVLPIEDGFYDLLLEKYKTYDSDFQVGSAIIEFRNFIENDIENHNHRQIATSPVIFGKIPERDEIHQDTYEKIMRINEPILNRRDYSESPIEFMDSSITKRTHNTEHNHPSLVGTLDKCKFIFIKDAREAGVLDDPNVKILERDFFYDHIEKHVYEPNRILNVVAELKYDGISVEADCGSEVYSARTRGDTGIGAAADITPILRGYRFKHAQCMDGENPIGVKFEAIMTKSNLETFNKLRERNYKNCRTAIVGLFGASDAYLFRDLITLIPLALDKDDIPMISNRMEEIAFLNKVFVSDGEPLRYCYFSGTVLEILYYIKVFMDEAKVARDYLNFMYDGIVISYLDEDIREKLGRKNFINKYSMAVKFDPLEKQTIFRGYTYEVGQNGQITPMIHYDPVEFLGTIHVKSTGSSLNRFKQLGLRYGDIINVTYVNDVMPYVSTLNCEQNRRNTNPVIEPIVECPICGTNLIESDSGKTLLCPNIECPGRSVQRMVNMFSKLNIKGFADAAFISLGKNHLFELIDLSTDFLIEKLGQADGVKFAQEINKLITDPIKDFIVIGALGFNSIAHKKWQNILQQCSLKEINAMYLSSVAEQEFEMKLLERIPNIGPITAYTIAKEYPFFEKDIACVLSWNNLVNSYGTGSNLKKQVRFTGIRNKQLSELLCNVGYDADGDSSVTKKTEILIVPYEGFSSSKISKVSDFCKIIPIDEFINNIGLYIDAEDAIYIKNHLS